MYTNISNDALVQERAGRDIGRDEIALGKILETLEHISKGGQPKKRSDFQ
jgi:hypothetical protein